MRNSMGLATVFLVGCTAGAGLHMGGSSSASGGASGGGGTHSGGDRVVATDSAPELDDFSFALKEYTGRYASAFVTNKLTTFKVAPACMKKMIDKDGGALHTASFYTRDILEYGKAVTGDDWSAIEDQNRDKNVKLIAPMMEDFHNRFNVTVYVEGDDCDTDSNSLWLRYWYAVGTAVKDYPPKSGRAFITLNVTPTVKGRHRRRRLDGLAVHDHGAARHRAA
jgi:hypothetical protein